MLKKLFVHRALPHYEDKEWDWLRGALATVDRSYGIFNYFHHHVSQFQREAQRCGHCAPCHAPLRAEAALTHTVVLPCRLPTRMWPTTSSRRCCLMWIPVAFPSCCKAVPAGVEQHVELFACCADAALPRGGGHPCHQAHPGRLLHVGRSRGGLHVHGLLSPPALRL
jgi:hypothetical protein